MKIMNTLRNLPLSEKILLSAALLCTLTVIVVQTLGLSGQIPSEVSTLIALPFLGTAALLIGIRNLHLCKTKKTALSTAVLDFVAAIVIYFCCVLIAVTRLLG